HRAGGCAVPPLEIGLQPIQLWPYRAGLAAPRPGRLQTAAASLACSCPRQVSPPGKPGDPGTFPPSSSLLSRGYDEAPHGAHRACGSPAHGSPTPFTGGIRLDPPVLEGIRGDDSCQGDQPELVRGPAGEDRPAALPRPP